MNARDAEPVLALVVARIAWGFMGNRYARFANFVRSPSFTARYTATVLKHRDARYLGHNPLGALMILVLLACLVALAFTGWLFTTDAFWGEAWLEQLHEFLAWSLSAFVAMHLAGVVFTCLRHRENLVSAMFTGKKRAPANGDIQ